MSLEIDSEEIYRMYPKKKDKRFAMACIQRAIQRLEDGESGRRLLYCDAVLFLLTAVQEFSESPAGNRGSYTPYPATWMNRSSYLDDRREWQELKREEIAELKQRAAANIGVYRP